MADTCGRDAEGNPLWRTPAGGVVSCVESVKVLNENYREVAGALRDAMEDAVLLGCSLEQVRGVYRDLVEGMRIEYAEKTPAGGVSGENPANPHAKEDGR